MRIQKKLLVIPAALLLAGASGIGFVHASTGGATPQTLSVSADPNTADVQQGSQSTPDLAGAAAEADAPEAASAIDAPGGPDVQQGDQTGADTGN